MKLFKNEIEEHTVEARASTRPNPEAVWLRPDDPDAVVPVIEFKLPTAEFTLAAMGDLRDEDDGVLRIRLIRRWWQDASSSTLEVFRNGRWARPSLID